MSSASLPLTRLPDPGAPGVNRVMRQPRTALVGRDEDRMGAERPVLDPLVGQALGPRVRAEQAEHVAGARGQGPPHGGTGGSPVLEVDGEDDVHLRAHRAAGRRLDDVRDLADALLARSKLLVEYSGAAAIAALRAGRYRPAGRPTAVVLSGGNRRLS